jgi:hypothetical protein
MENSDLPATKQDLREMEMRLTENLSGVHTDVLQLQIRQLTLETVTRRHGAEIIKLDVRLSQIEKRFPPAA